MPIVYIAPSQGETTMTTKSIRVYKVEATFEHDGQLLSCNQAEVLGDAYNARYLSEAAAAEAAEAEQDALEGSELDPTTRYHVVKADLLEYVRVTEEWRDQDANGEDLPPNEYNGYVSVDIRVDGVRRSVGTMVGAHDSDHGSIRAAGCGVRPYLSTWFEDPSDWQSVGKELQPAVAELLARNANQIWNELEELRK